MDEKSDTMTNELLSARQVENENQATDDEGKICYHEIIEEREQRKSSTILRFIDEDQKYLDIQQPRKRKQSKRIKMIKNKFCQRKKSKSGSTKFSHLSLA